MKVILSIKPEFAEKIFEGEKQYEFRRTLFKNPIVSKVIVYASAPISRVIGEFNIENILHDTLDILWDYTNEQSGISHEYYREYFHGKDKGYAIKISSPTRYQTDYCIREKYGLNPPQSFAYVK